MSLLRIRFRGNDVGSQGPIFQLVRKKSLAWKIEGNFVEIHYGTTIKAIPSDLILEVTEELSTAKTLRCRPCAFKALDSDLLEAVPHRMR